MRRHRWTEQDDITALYLYRYSPTDVPTIENAARMCGVTSDSMRMRIANFRALDSKSGLDHIAQQSIAVYQRYRGSSQSELRALARL